jgi:hypothetical protein
MIWCPRFRGEKRESTWIKMDISGVGSKGRATRELFAKMSLAFSMLMRMAGICRSLPCGHSRFLPYECL